MSNLRFTKSNQDGFTLIELIIVIVILGILAVTAAPKFINITSDANISVLKSVGGAMESAGQLVYAKSIIKGEQSKAAGGIDIDGDGTTDIKTIYGYPSGDRNDGISKAMDDNFAENFTWSTKYNSTTFYVTTAKIGKRSGVYVNQTHIVPTNCYLIYDSAKIAGAKPTIQYVTTGC